ncbi:MAG: hypothetical protein AAEJ52_08070 [Myxococcota bacterium]
MTGEAERTSMKVRWHRFVIPGRSHDYPYARHRPTRLWFVSTLRLAFCLPFLAIHAFFATPACAESELVLPYPTSFGRIPASTFDTEQHHLGAATLVIERLDDGKVRLTAESGVDGGAKTIATAELVPIDEGRKLRLVSQSSRSFDANGTALGVLAIDHDKREGSCTTPHEHGETIETIPLPRHDRVANVPLNLLFDPLVRGASSSVDFQILLCRGGARLMDFRASVVRREERTAENPDIVEVRYGPDLGMIVSLIARAVTPKLAFWFDPSAPARWLAHRMPLYSDGPEVFVVRQGVSANLFID